VQRMTTSLDLARRHWCLKGASWLAAGVVSVSDVLAAAPDVLPASRSLPQELAAALAKDHPLIVMVSLAGCPYCHAARRSYLLPMWREGVPLVQVDMRSQTSSVDFNGQRVTHDQLVQQWRISIAPTLLFFGPQGREVAERMEGGYLPDFYGAYLEARIQKARSSW
jgi:thioredoxin-related protein